MKRIPAEVILLTLFVAGCDPGPAGPTAGGTTRVSLAPSVGQMAPDITGEDIDGVAFALSDYRGKVVMLDFWGDW